MEDAASPNSFQLELVALRSLLWGPEVKADIFKRWSQGFCFSTNESTALEQIEGGPCSVIAPVQAFILKNLLIEHQNLSFKETPISKERQDTLLAAALSEILSQCISGTENNNINIVASECVAGEFEINASRFHGNLRVTRFDSSADAAKHYLENSSSLYAPTAVLSFLYSVILTRGLQQVRVESDSQEPLIDETYGYGSQSVTNLMLTGRATPFVWDHEQDIGGLKLRGLECQNQVGFLTTMESHMFCTVGSFYKNPIHPVWVLGSDTHLTVLFSDERRLVRPETKSEQARRVFKSFDPDGNNFIGADKLGAVMEALGLVSEPEYVNIMRRKLDSESLGIILLHGFMEEFFGRESAQVAPDVFVLAHYNGLPQSNKKGRIQYCIGNAVLLESDIRSVCESNPMLTVLQTKWQNIEVSWREDVPSLN